MKALIFQVLLDEAEENLDLPAFLVDCRDGFGRQLEMVGEKDVAPAGGGILVSDTGRAWGIPGIWRRSAGMVLCRRATLAFN